ncbi:U6 snRNA-associated Sm-like protein LSm2 [Pisolithus marmoratus]|nr:U6 snRNA-associated Sm-like protein LSm2 [Pisolithus marmoratus]
MQPPRQLTNDLSITGVLKSVDQFLNIRLDSIKVLDEARHPHMMAVKNCFIRGSVVRYVQLPAEHVDTQLLEDATRRGRKSGKAVTQSCTTQ